MFIKAQNHLYREIFEMQAMQAFSEANKPGEQQAMSKAKRKTV